MIFFIFGDWCNGLKVDWGINLCNFHVYVYVHNLIDEIELQPSVVWFSIGMIQRIVFFWKTFFVSLFWNVLRN